jgi:DNA-binding phage protein
MGPGLDTVIKVLLALNLRLVAESIGRSDEIGLKAKG